MVKQSGILLLIAAMAVISACGSNNGNDSNGNSSSTNASTNGSSDASANESQEPAKDPVTIKYLTYTANGGQENTLKSMVEAFEAKNPDVKVDYEVVPYADYDTKLTTLISGGQAPDVYELGYENFRKYAGKDLLLDLTPIISADSSFDPSTYKKLAYDAFNYNGKQMGVTESFSDVVLFYNKDLFDAKGVKYPDASWTWKEELDAAQKLADPANGVWGTYSPFQFYEFYKTIAQNGGGVFDASGNPTINSQANIDAVQWMIDKAEKYKVSPAMNDDTFSQPDADLNAFMSGKIAMARFGIWNFSRFKDAKFKWDIALEPGNTQKAHHFFADGIVASKDTKQAEAVWKFMKYFTSDADSVNKRIAAGWSVPAVADDAVLDAYYKQAPPESKKVVIDALDSLVLPPVGPKPEKWGELQAAVTEQLDKAKFGKISVKEALDNAQKSVADLLSK
ncbi:carbohydrate ABC transporter substrate-binding protein (CUT1 family) [Paenibacillus taihuensis]|uniref:Carbohydrate ABC transporter substrate-binding protein (CUT1 family) n=1 Tax=Paenibacillus taihuensis TaxID=1156355 RepID=A0A3D9QZU2_9BACL|nr:sugar ABC transporter substrate-binding protein [Paenibacillus taihuensis]REE66647.1 carbohydrate ABC transporter substrate-binding protein (CUT1 family) [Paenibacillus taihuensis]